MTVYFVCRCHYDLPTCFHVKNFEADSVLEWFQQIWQPIADADEAYRYADELIGYQVYSFGSLFTEIAEQDEDPPETLTDARDFLEGAVYCEEVRETDGALQVLTDDDELELAYYIFDDTFAKKYPEKVAILIREDWQLPTDWTEGDFKPIRQSNYRLPKGSRAGSLWVADLMYYDSYSLSDLEEVGGDDRLIPNSRLPDLPRVLVETDWILGEDGSMGDLKDAMLIAPPDLSIQEQGFYLEINKDPQEATNWEVYSDWLLEQELSPSKTLLERALQKYSEHQSELDEETSNLSLIQVDDHVAQICLHKHRWVWSRRTVNCFQRRIFFDDWWAAANRDLANSILHCASRWDVLS